MKTPVGFSDEKGASNYWLDAVRDMWAVTELDTDCVDVQEIVNYFDEKRGLEENDVRIVGRIPTNSKEQVMANTQQKIDSYQQKINSSREEITRLLDARDELDEKITELKLQIKDLEQAQRDETKEEIARLKRNL